MSRTRTRLTDSPSEFERVVDEYAQRGYDVQRNGTAPVAVCEANDWGNLWVHLLLLIFTVGFGNVLYGLYRSMTADKVEVRVRD